MRALRSPTIPRLALVSAALAFCGACSAANEDSGHAVVLLYHHVATGTPPSTSVTPATFESHLDFLEDNGFQVRPLTEIAEALKAGDPLPPKTVALSFDDAYVSIYEEALPRLKRRGWPFTVFVATEPVDRGYGGFMSWEQLREIESSGGTIANHTASHAHLVRRRQGEAQGEWLKRVRYEITSAQARLDAELDRPPLLFAYPFGEFDREVEAVVEDLGYVGFGQQSGPIGHGTDLQNLPRFPVATGYDDLESLEDKLESRPLPVTVTSPKRRVLDAGAAAPTLELDVGDGPFRREALTCYVSGQPPATLEWDGSTVRVTAKRPLGPGRSKYNCTAPSTRDTGVFYWYSHLWIQPEADGSWYRE